ncbi:hypothetical protein [Campylobacter showae]|nr:hypothetical protein [Campylobacter showae]
MTSQVDRIRNLRLAILAQIYQILLLWCYRVGMFRETINLGSGDIL